MALRRLTGWLKLTVSEEKTHVCQMPEGHFNFLGYTFERCYSEKTGRAYLGKRREKKRRRGRGAAISAQTERRDTGLKAEIVVKRLNRMLTGWANYFCLGPVSKSYRVLDEHAAMRLRRWLLNKHKVESVGIKRFPYEYLNDIG